MKPKDQAFASSLVSSAIAICFGADGLLNVTRYYTSTFWKVLSVFCIVGGVLGVFLAIRKRRRERVGGA